MRMLSLVVISLVLIGCSRSFPTSGRGTELAVWAYEKFPPDGNKPVRFRLSPAELASVHVPDVSAAEEHGCKCGVPPFGIELFEPGAVTPFVEGHFFHGPDELTLTFTKGGSGRLVGQKRFHDAIVSVIRQRGHWK